MVQPILSRSARVYVNCKCGLSSMFEVASELSIADSILSGPIRADKDRSVFRIRREPISDPIFIKLVNELVNVEVTEDHPSLVNS